MTVWAHSRCLLPPAPLISKLLIPALSPVNDYLTITYLTSEICVTAALWRQLSATNAIHKLLPGRCANPPPPPSPFEFPPLLEKCARGENEGFVHFLFP